MWYHEHKTNSYYVYGYDLYYIGTKSKYESTKSAILNSVFGIKRDLEQGMQFEGVLEFDKLSVIYPSSEPQKITDSPEMKALISDINKSYIKKQKALQFHRVYDYYRDVCHPDEQTIEKLPDGRYKITIVTSKHDAFVMNEVYNIVKGLE